MAFTPVVKEKEILGKVYKAQFSGFSALLKAQSEIGDDSEKLANYVFKTVIVSPKIADIDEHCGTNAKLFSEILDFGSKVMGADPEYFPENADEEATGDSKK